VSELASAPRRLVVCLGLIALTLVAYEGVRRCGFVAFDDDVFVYRNPQVRAGLTWAGVRWAFSADLLFESSNADYWMPLTILSRMTDVQLFGLNPAAHHATNVVLHALHAVLLFLLFDGLTGARWRSAFVAAAVAVHPLTVESVAWVTERKNVLAAVFWALSLLAYARWAKRGSRPAYAAAVGLMALGLMAKPSLIVLPGVLLALDYWPLRRMRGLADVRPLVMEKAPFVVLSLASCVITVVAVSRGGHVAASEAVPFLDRLLNAAQSIVAYLRQALWPSDLAVFYPYPRSGLAARGVASALLLAGASWLAIRGGRARPWLAVGWLWMLLCLVPVLGIVQSGQQARADRFMYLPLAGLGIIAAWGGAELLARWRPAAAAAALVALAAWVLVTREQVRQWTDTITLFSHALAVTQDNHLAHSNLGTALALRGDVAGAEAHYREAIRIDPRYAEAQTALGVVLAHQGRFPEALERQREALRLSPQSSKVLFNLAAVEARLGDAASAERHYALAVAATPQLAAAHYNWGNLLAAQGRWGEAEARYAAVLQIDPNDVEARNNLGLAVGLQGRWEEAARILEPLVQQVPDHARARTNLARALRELGRPDEARRLLEEGLRRKPDDAELKRALEE
jgi:Flp pilus assembly protein TadD